MKAINMKRINTCKRKKCGNKQSGVTLIELLIVVVIISIIAAFAYPSYTQFVVRAKRTAGKAMLLQVADRQQQFFMDNKRYANSLTLLGFPANPFMIGDDGDYVAVGDSDRVYMITVATPTSTSFTATAVPQMFMASEDTDCANLFLLQTGEKGQTGGGDNCW